MNPSSIGKKAVSIIESCIADNDYLNSDINRDDTIPTWDGHIYVYNDKKHPKNDLLGRVYIQVKGTLQTNLTQQKIKAQVKKSDLENYLNDGGAIYFIVYYDKASKNHTIYYASLLPFDIKKILRTIPKQSKNIEFSKFPEFDLTEMTDIFLNFVRDKKLQSSSVDESILSMAEFDKKKIEVEKFTFGFTTIDLESSPERIFSTRPFFMYVQPKGLDVYVPVEKIDPQKEIAIISKPIRISVGVGEKIYYDHVLEIYKEGNLSLHFGKSFQIKIVNNSFSKFSHIIKGTLKEQLYDLQFLMQVFETGSITIQGNKILYCLPKNWKVTREQFLKQLEFLETVQETFRNIGIQSDLEYDKLTPQERTNLFNLVIALKHNKTVKFSNLSDDFIWGHFKLANIDILLTAQKQKDGQYLISNFFKELLVLCYPASDSESWQPFLAPHYLMLSRTDFANASNLNYDMMLNEFSRSTITEAYFDILTLYILEVIHGYDLQESKNDKLLDFADALYDLLLHRELEKEMYYLIAINKLQIAKRKKSLTKREYSKLIEIKNNTNDFGIILAANIILENNNEAKIYFDKLTKKEQADFKTYPIFTLWKDKSV